jgi:hypothetical protein
MKGSEAYEHSGWTIAIPVKLIHAISAKGAILVSKLFYGKGKELSEDGWIYKKESRQKKIKDAQHRCQLAGRSATDAFPMVSSNSGRRDAISPGGGGLMLDPPSLEDAL